MFTLRERIEIIVLIVIVVFGTPIAMSFGASQAQEDAKILYPYEIPKEVQRAMDQAK